MLDAHDPSLTLIMSCLKLRPRPDSSKCLLPLARLNSTGDQAPPTPGGKPPPDASSSCRSQRKAGASRSNTTRRQAFPMPDTLLEFRNLLWQSGNPRMYKIANSRSYCDDWHNFILLWKCQEFFQKISRNCKLGLRMLAIERHLGFFSFFFLIVASVCHSGSGGPKVASRLPIFAE